METRYDCAKRYAPVICMPRPLGARDNEDIAGLKCRDLTYDVSPSAGILISCLNNRSLGKQQGKDQHVHLHQLFLSQFILLLAKS